MNYFITIIFLKQTSKSIFELCIHVQLLLIIQCGFNQARITQRTCTYLWGEIPQHQPAAGSGGAVGAPGGSLCDRHKDT